MSVTHKTRKTRTKLSPVDMHEFDILRAAKMGIDISHLKPDERCKYPSRFCCHKRVRKSTGKLHRFCEFHRSRANVNQKRWTEIRRRQERTRQMIETSQMLMASDWDTKAAAAAVVSPLLVPTVVTPRPSGASINIQTPPWLSMQRCEKHPESPTCVDAVVTQDDDALTLSDDEIDQLMTMMAADSTDSPTDTDMDLLEPCLPSMGLLEDELAVITPELFDELALAAF